MYFFHKREGHPFIKNDTYFFNDLEDYVLARARGLFFGIMTGEMHIDDIGQLTVLDFESEKRYILENNEDALLKKEIYKKLIESGIHYDKDDIDEDEILRLREDTCFAVVLERVKEIDGDLYLELTAIHKKYRKALFVQKKLNKRTREPFEVQEIEYEEIDSALEILLGHLIWEYLSIYLNVDLSDV